MNKDVRSAEKFGRKSGRRRGRKMNVVVNRLGKRKARRRRGSRCFRERLCAELELSRKAESSIVELLRRRNVGAFCRGCAETKDHSWAQLPLIR